MYRADLRCFEQRRSEIAIDTLSNKYYDHCLCSLKKGKNLPKKKIEFDRLTTKKLE